MNKKVLPYIIGIFSGLVNGIFGSGGGIIIVPSLIFLLKLEEHKAHATAITIILPLSIISSIIYFKNGLIDIKVSLIIAIGSTVGGIIGAKSLNKIPSNLLRKIFSLIIIYISIRMITG